MVCVGTESVCGVALPAPTMMVAVVVRVGGFVVPTVPLPRLIEITLFATGAASAASGTNRHGKSYSVQITTPLEFSRSCAISNKVLKPVKGVRVITYYTNKTVTIEPRNLLKRMTILDKRTSAFRAFYY